MRLGCAWYPEQWSEAVWATDLALMRDAGMNVVRVGEFAWSRMEPEEGRYDFDWLERAIALAGRHGFETVIGTPTAAPPAWLTRRYPETLLVREDNRVAEHGNRCHYCPASDRYVAFCRVIARELAARFGRNPSVVGWQIDNEYNVTPYGEETRRKFREFLRARHGNLSSLNARWTTAYWSQTYFDWDEIPLPAGPHNPGLMLEFRRFVSQTYVDYQRAQIDAIRAHSEYPITHNSMGWFEAFDHEQVARDLDFASWDSYVGTGHLDYVEMGSKHDLVRGLLRKNFWLMETQPSSVNWAGVNNALNRGEVRTMAWQAVGHGADAVLYWQWRSALNGQEQYHGSLVGPDGRPRPVYSEVRGLAEDFARAAAALRGTSPRSECAIIESYDDRWAINMQRHHRDFEPGAHLKSFYRALRAEVHTVDVIPPRASLTGYRLVVAPHLHLLEEDVARALEAFVRRGGHLVLGPRSGMKDRWSALLASRQPGPLAPALGAHVEEYYALDANVPLEGSGEARIWAEWLEPDAPDVRVICRYGAFNGWLDGRAAVVSRDLDGGRITYVGAWLDDATMTSLAREWVESSGLDAVRAPDGVELCRRTSSTCEIWIAINHTAKARAITLPFFGVELLTGGPSRGEVSLGPYGVAVVRRADRPAG